MAEEQRQPTPEELAVVQQFTDAVRQSPEVVRSAGILRRAHSAYTNSFVYVGLLGGVEVSTLLRPIIDDVSQGRPVSALLKVGLGVAVEALPVANTIIKHRKVKTAEQTFDQAVDTVVEQTARRMFPELSDDQPTEEEKGQEA